VVLEKDAAHGRSLSGAMGELSPMMILLWAKTPPPSMHGNVSIFPTFQYPGLPPIIGSAESIFYQPLFSPPP